MVCEQMHLEIVHVGSFVVVFLAPLQQHSSPGHIDTSDPNWRVAVREELLGDEPTPCSSDSSNVDDEFDQELDEPAIKSVTEAMASGERLRQFAQFHGYQELVLAVAKANDLLSEIKLTGQRQTRMDDSFK